MPRPRKFEVVLRELASQYASLTVTEPRQSGKTTLCRSVCPDHGYVNLEPVDQREFACEEPRGLNGMLTTDWNMHASLRWMNLTWRSFSDRDQSGNSRRRIQLLQRVARSLRFRIANEFNSDHRWSGPCHLAVLGSMR